MTHYWHIQGVIPTSQFNASNDMPTILTSTTNNMIYQGSKSLNCYATILKQKYEYINYVNASSSNNKRQTNDYQTIIHIPNTELINY